MTGQLLGFSISRALTSAGAGAEAGREKAEVRRVASVKVVVKDIILSVGESGFEVYFVFDCSIR